MSEPVRIADEVGRVSDGGAWHGPSLSENLAGLTADEAATRPLAEAHTIWEIVLHLTAWANEVAERLHRRVRRLSDADDWPAVSETGDDAWSEAQRALFDAHRRLRLAIREFPPQRLGESVAGQEGGDHPVSFYLMLHGLSQHDAYHAGQIALLRKALRQ